MLRTAGGGAACDAAHRAHSCSDDEFVVKVAAAVAADEKVHATACSVSTFLLIVTLFSQPKTGTGSAR
jgi:hypothetical protein